MTFDFEAGVAPPAVEAGGLPSTFRLAQLHFHWGEKATFGSEHLVDGRAFPLEMHLVHYNEK